MTGFRISNGQKKPTTNNPRHQSLLCTCSFLFRGRLCVCALARDKTSFRKMRTLTDTCGHGAVPLGQGIGHGLAPDGSGAVQRVAWIAFKQHRHACAKVVADALPKPGLRDRAALNGARPGDGCKRGVTRRRGTGGQENEETKRCGCVAGCVRWGNNAWKERRQRQRRQGAEKNYKALAKVGLISPHVISHSVLCTLASCRSTLVVDGNVLTASGQMLSNVISACKKKTKNKSICTRRGKCHRLTQSASKSSCTP